MFILFTCLLQSTTAQSDAELVDRWFARQPSEWARARENCDHIVVMFSDRNWLDLTLQTARELSVTPRTCVALWLWLAGNTSAVHGPELCFIDERASESARWGTRVYFNKIAHRMPVMAALIEALPLEAHRGLALIDSDVAVFRRALCVRFERANATMVLQQEWPCITAPHHLCANGGVWWVRRTLAGRRLLRRTAELMQRLAAPDQDALDVVLSTVPDVHYLDRWRYANGHVVQNDASWRRSSAHLVHANWLSDLRAKKALLERMKRREF